MKLLIILALLFYFSNAQSSEFETINGYGIISIEFDDSIKSISFYSKPNLNSKIGSLQLVEPWENNEYWKWVQPETFKPDYHLVEFRYKSETKEFYQIFTNVKDRPSLWIKKSINLKYLKWNDYFLKVLSIQSINKFKIYSKPSLDSRTIQIDCDSFKVLAVRGNWFKVERSFVCDENTNTNINGWIQWRIENKILIRWFNLA